jgi:hypothetical protein
LTDTDNDRIEVSEAGWEAARIAFQMEDPHIKGYISGTFVTRLTRALRAYEWAKREYPVHTGPNAQWVQDIPDDDTVRAAVLAMEADDE